ncbi:Pheophorbide a oxygenase [Klebsormidium nitens]|uniref:Pheophorbide a oxygenase n=1 Tax=Klebsormidium nitens TaxID=105231 RepID=A0A1Y1HNZ9_KLENI|nr:Pheophorbide a oxygenase [Klebsormidium nitens]|eukprot:GAQ78701.1 Pheophorbide a oxygenase [Klebsormidium nitens]
MAQVQALGSCRKFSGWSTQRHCRVLPSSVITPFPPPSHRLRISKSLSRQSSYSQQHRRSCFSVSTCRLSGESKDPNNKKELSSGDAIKLKWSQTSPRKTQQCRSSSVGVEAFQEQARGLQGDGTITLSREEEGESLPGSEPAQKDANQSAPGGHDFQWAENWYPIAVERDVRKELPLAVTILGKPLVLWWDRNKREKGQPGGWRAFLDMCPHRLAPLSEGRIDEAGRLQCSYHGWSFDGDARCQSIPQAEKEGPQAAAHSSPRACAQPFPTLLQNGLVWVWLDPATADTALKRPPPHVPEMDDPSFSKDLVARDFPYGYDFLVENLMDPSHLPFAHHGIMSNRSRAGPLRITLRGENPRGFVAEQHPQGKADFSAPVLFTQDINIPPKEKDAAKGGSGKKIRLCFWLTPVSPGRSRLFYAFPQNFVTWLFALIPRWLLHIRQHSILDSDLMILHLAEKRLQREGGGTDNWSRAYFMPTAADRYIVAFRRWLTKHGGGQPDFGPQPEPAPTAAQPGRMELMDRYESHTKHCSSCSKAVRRLEALQKGLAFGSVSIVALVSALASGGVVKAQAYGPYALLGALVMAVSAFGLKGVIQKFYVEDYIHALVK